MRFESRVGEALQLLQHVRAQSSQSASCSMPAPAMEPPACKRMRLRYQRMRRDEEATFNDVMAQDWMTRNETLVRMQGSLSHWVLINFWLSPTDAIDGKCEGRRAIEGEVIALPDAERMNDRLTLCKVFGRGCYKCNC